MDVTDQQILEARTTLESLAPGFLTNEHVRIVIGQLNKLLAERAENRECQKRVLDFMGHYPIATARASRIAETRPIDAIKIFREEVKAQSGADPGLTQAKEVIDFMRTLP